MKRFVLIILLLSISPMVLSQSWRYVRHEAYFGVGITNFMGDLGGSRGIGTHGPKDFKIQPTRPTIAMGYKYMIVPELSVKGGITWGFISGDDAHTKNVVRNTRNLSFRSPLAEFAASLEFYPWGERVTPKYKIRGVNGNKTFSIIPYFTAGVGFALFNPKAKLNGNWIALQPLGTEGQGLNGRPDPYRRITMAFPVGFGLRYVIDKTWSLSFQGTLNYTTTDYLDDVSTSYYHYDEIEAAYGTDAAILSDRTNDPSLGYTGVNPLGDGRYNFLQRGDPKWNDAYMFAIISVHYRFRKGGTFIPKF